MIQRTLVMSDGAVKPLIATLNCTSCGHHEGIYNPRDRRLNIIMRKLRARGVGKIDCPNASDDITPAGRCFALYPMHLAMHERSAA